MDKIRLSSIDMNLLVALDTLLSEGSVTAAARRHGVTQSAMSHNLARLRELFGDKLLVRVGARMQPTPRAQQLLPELRGALIQVEAVLSGGSTFDPATAEMVFHIAATDYGAAFVAPMLFGHLQRTAPLLRFVISPLSYRDIAAQLAAGDVQLVAGLPFDDLPGVVTQSLLEEGYTSLVNPEHPLLQRPEDVAAFAAARHCLVSPFGSGGASPVDRALAALGLKRRVVLELPFFMAAPQVIASSDLVLTLPSRLAELFAATYQLATFAPPLSLPRSKIFQAWHERYHDEPSLRWLRDTIAEVVRALDHMSFSEKLALSRGRPAAHK